jgi:hypothetical protein
MTMYCGVFRHFHATPAYHSSMHVIWFNVTNIPNIQLLSSELNRHQFNVQTNLMSASHVAAKL